MKQRKWAGRRHTCSASVYPSFLVVHWPRDSTQHVSIVRPVRFKFASVVPEYTMSNGDSLAALPVHAIAASKKYLVALTGGNILLYDVRTGERLAALDACVDPSVAPVSLAGFPRLCAISPRETYVAVASDDKVLRVWDTSNVAYGQEVLVQRLAKRTGAMQWVQDDEIIVADKFGDVWSFEIDPSRYMLDQPQQQQPQQKEPSAIVADADTDDQTLQPKLGHVSMVTCLAFLRDHETSPKSIVTCDRDEHIRISRWGPRRAAHIVEQYLLGSRSCVGALTVVPADRASRAGLPCSSQPVLVTSDGGACLRVWCCHADGKYRLHATVHLDVHALLEHVTVDAAIERRREKDAGNLAAKDTVFDPHKTEPETKRQKSDEHQECNSSTADSQPSLVIHHLSHFISDDRDWLLVCIEGARAVFVVPLDHLTKDRSTPALPVIVTCRMNAPILDVSLVPEASGGDLSGAPKLWLCCDDRPGMGSGPSVSEFAWRDDHFEACEVPPMNTSLRALVAPDSSAATTPRASASPAALSKLCLYSQIMTWPKPPQPNADGTPFLSYAWGDRSETVARQMYDRFQSGKRAAGRARNQASIQQQFGGNNS